MEITAKVRMALRIASKVRNLVKTIERVRNLRIQKKKIGAKMTKTNIRNQKLVHSRQRHLVLVKEMTAHVRELTVK